MMEYEHEMLFHRILTMMVDLDLFGHQTAAELYSIRKYLWEVK